MPLPPLSTRFALWEGGDSLGAGLPFLAVPLLEHAYSSMSLRF